MATLTRTEAGLVRFLLDNPDLVTAPDPLPDIEEVKESIEMGEAKSGKVSRTYRLSSDVADELKATLEEDGEGRDLSEFVEAAIREKLTRRKLGISAAREIHSVRPRQHGFGPR